MADNNVKKKRIPLVAPIAAFALLIIAATVYAFNTPYAYVSLDVNPSLEYSVNIFKQVLSVKGMNEQGTALLEKISTDELKFKNIDKAITMTVEALSSEGYLKDNATIVITTSTATNNMFKADNLATEIEDAAISEVETNDTTEDDDTVVTAEAIGAERVEEARKLEVTPGKLNLVEKLIEAAGDGAEINRDEWLYERSVQDILKETNRYRELNREQISHSDDETESTIRETERETERDTERDSDGTGAGTKGQGTTKGTSNSNKK